MPTYSHSRLSTYENCPLQYKFVYIDRIKREKEGIEAFLGNRVHETLKKCYDNLQRTKCATLDELLECYNGLWHKNWHDSISINREDLSAEHYRSLGEKMLETYYRRYIPTCTDLTIGTELILNFPLDDGNKYRFTGLVDRLAKDPSGIFWIHDYKTGGHLPGQDDVDRERQLALYQIGVRKRWPDFKNIRLVWHYLAFDCELVSSRTEDSLKQLVTDTIKLIDTIEADNKFAPRETPLCEWCDYPDLCPQRKSGEIDRDLEKVKEALIEYAKRENVNVIKGSVHKARIKFDKKLKFPGKNEPERDSLDNTIIQAGKWSDVSQLDTTALSRIIEHQSWDRSLIERVLKYGKLEQSTTISLSRTKEAEE